MKLFWKKYKTVLTPEQRKIRKQHLLLGLLSGVILGISFPPVPLPYFAFVALVPFFIVLEKKESLAEINRFTYFTFYFFTLITLYWIGSWTKEADPFLMISGVALLFFNPILFLIPSTLYYYAKKSFNKKAALLLFPFFWVTYEYVYGLTDMRFPWLTLGHGQAMLKSFIQIADIIGSLGLSVLVVFINVFLYFTYKFYKEKRKLNGFYAGIFLLLLIGPIVYGNIRLNTYKADGEKIKVGVVQPNLDPWEKWKAGNLREQLDMYLNFSGKAIEDSVKLILWPETALPVYLLTGNYAPFVTKIHDFVRQNKIYLITGMPDATFYYDKTKAPKDAKPTGNGDILYTSYNSILLFSPYTNKIQKYGKIKLVPFGEHVPFVETFPFFGDFIKWNVGISSWNVGKDTTVFKMPLLAQNDENKFTPSVKAAGLVCIESIYPAFVAAFVQRGAQLITVVTNDSWYGNSSGPYQHEEISVLRAVENRRTVVRAANGGISCFVNPLGIIEKETKMFTKTYLTGEAQLNSDLTFYTKYPLLIPLFASFLSLCVIIVFIYYRFVKKNFGNRKDST